MANVHHERETGGRQASRSTLEWRSGRLVDVTEDNRDRFGSPGVRRSTCKTLEKREAGERFGFVLRGCEGAASEIVIP